MPFDEENKTPFICPGTQISIYFGISRVANYDPVRGTELSYVWLEHAPKIGLMHCNHWTHYHQINTDGDDLLRRPSVATTGSPESLDRRGCCMMCRPRSFAPGSVHLVVLCDRTV
jgi:hypothetical protein